MFRLILLIYGVKYEKPFVNIYLGKFRGFNDWKIDRK